MLNQLKLRSATSLWIATFALGLLVLIASLTDILPTAADQKYQHRYEPANTTELLSAANAIPVKVGAYIENYHDLSLQNRRFVAEGYYWLEWPQALQDVIEKDNIKPIDVFEITNQVDDWDSVFRSVNETATKLPNGNYYYLVRFSGNFYIPVTWTPKPEPMLMRASPPARLGKEKLHESQTPQPRADHPQAAHR